MFSTSTTKGVLESLPWIKEGWYGGLQAVSLLACFVFGIHILHTYLRGQIKKAIYLREKKKFAEHQ